MSDFEYTDSKAVRSSAVDEVFYNADDKALVVVLHAEAYLYTGVPQSVYNDLVFGWGSVGRKYAKNVKQKYGPGEYLGHVLDLEFSEKSYEAPDMSNVISLPTKGFATGGPVKAPTPKGLSLASDAKVTGERISLRQPEVFDQAVRPHTVVFAVEGREGLRKHTYLTDSVESAVEDLESLADALDQTFVVQEVTVSFV